MRNWQDLADKGLYVHTVHVRLKKDGAIQPRGGITVVEIRAREDNTVVGFGEARCNPKDNYNKRRGRDIAAGRAIKGLAEARFGL